MAYRYERRDVIVYKKLVEKEDGNTEPKIWTFIGEDIYNVKAKPGAEKVEKALDLQGARVKPISTKFKADLGINETTKTVFVNEIL